MRFSAVLFDFDGVLVDSEPVRFAAGASALATVGIELTWEMFLRYWFGRTDRAGLGDILGTRFAEEGPAVVAHRNAIVAERLDEISLFPDAERFIARVPSKIKIGIVTGSRRIEVDAILRRVLPGRSFASITSAEDYTQPKPDPGPFLAGARAVQSTPSACLVLEDSPAGIIAAQRAGMRTVGVERGRFIPLPDATWRVASLDELTVSPDGEIRVAAASQR
ncbi:MAG TPA: HAD family phosphatase [Candidatus Baltobacteraceae bacterium]|nr:HAD family phosphatase [Candidatus Baltobacteraceae bacterium]